MPGQALGVLPVVVRPELAASDRLPPPAVVGVPPRRLGHGLPGVVRWGPAEGTQLVHVHGVAPVVAGAIRHVPHQRVVCAQGVQHDVHHLQIGHLSAGADVVDLAGLSVQQHRLDPGAVVMDMGIVAHLQTVAVDRDRLAQDCVGAEQRHGLLRVLVRPDVVRPARDGHRESVGDRVRLHQLIGRRLAGRVGAARGQVVGLHALVAVADVAVHLVGADVVNPDPKFPRHLQQDMRAAHVGVGEDQRPQDALIHMGLGRKVDDQVDAVILAGAAHEFLIPDISDDQRQVGLSPQVMQVLSAARVCELVEYDHMALRVLTQPVADEIAPNEAAASGDEYIVCHFDLSWCQ